MESLYVTLKEKIAGSWESVRENVRAELVNYDWNQEKLEHIIHKRVMDLAIRFVVAIDMKDKGICRICITETMLRDWNVDSEELYKTAIKNLYNAPISIDSINETIGCIFDCRSNLYVLRNQSGMYGAISIFRKDLLRKFAEEQNTDLIILPSSRHEVLLLPDHGEFCVHALRDMVREINETVVEPRDRLSNSVYRFSRDTGKLEIWDDGDK